MDIAIISNNLLKPLPSFYLTDPQHTHSSLQNCLPWILSDHRPKWSNEWSSHMLHLWSGTVWFHMISTLRCSEIRNCFPLHIPCKLHLHPNLYPMLALVNSPMESRSDDFFEEKDVKKDEKARHSEIKSLSQNHKEKRIPTGVRNRIQRLLLDAQWPHFVLYCLLNHKIWELEWTFADLFPKETNQPKSFPDLSMKLRLVKKQFGISPHSSINPWVFSSVPAPDLLFGWATSFQAQSGHKPPQPPSSLHFFSRTVSVMHGLLASCYSLHIYVSFFGSHHILLVCGCPPRILEKTNRFLKNTVKTSASGQVGVTATKFTLPPKTSKNQAKHLK